MIDTPLVTKMKIQGNSSREVTNLQPFNLVMRSKNYTDIVGESRYAVGENIQVPSAVKSFSVLQSQIAVCFEG